MLSKRTENRLERIRRQTGLYLMPEVNGNMFYKCIGCGGEFGVKELLYTCPACRQVLLIYDYNFSQLSKIDGKKWQEIFDHRKLLNIPALKGIFLFHELVAPQIPLESVVYLGEGHTPIVEANPYLQGIAEMRFFFKNDGQNPSASFKDRGMAAAISYIKWLIDEGYYDNVLSICASTGDTSAAAALYASYLNPNVKSAVLLPYKKVTPQQLAQPLGSGAKVFEIPGVFDDAMKVVEWLSENYNVALVNSKNAWRVLGQETYSFEVAQQFEYDMDGLVVVVPVGNAGNITALMGGFIKLFTLNIIDKLPKIIGVQSKHADPVFQYFRQPIDQRKFKPVIVQASVAQAAMIGNPVSMPRVIYLVKEYNKLADSENVLFVHVSEQDIMDWDIKATSNGHVNCTHGGECLAGLVKAIELGLVDPVNEYAVLNSTAHALKFAGFQTMYFEKSFPLEFGVKSNPEFINLPQLVHPEGIKKIPQPGCPLEDPEMDQFVEVTGMDIARQLKLKRK